jgi:hypothetical protein
VRSGLSSSYTIKSPGWQFSALHKASRVVSSILVSRRRVLILETDVGCIPTLAANSLLLILRSAITTANFQRITAGAQLLARTLQGDVSILQPSLTLVLPYRQYFLSYRLTCRSECTMLRMYKRKSDRPFASKTQGRSLSDYCLVKTHDITAQVSSRTPSRRNSRRTHRKATDPIVDLRDSQRSRKPHKSAARFGFCRSW